MTGASDGEKAQLRHFTGKRFEWPFWGVLEEMTSDIVFKRPVWGKYWNFELMSKDGPSPPTLFVTLIAY